MDIASYMDVLKFALKMQKDYVMEEMQKPTANEEYLEGIYRGLEIAMEKIEASAFLAEK
jgi:hypothetical protein